MSEKILTWIEKLATGDYKRLFWLLTAYIVVILLVSYPYIEASIFAPGRIEARINNLSDLIALSGSPLSDNPDLTAEYTNILAELELARKNAALGVKGTNYSTYEKGLKFFSGSIIFNIIAVLALFETIPPDEKRLKYFLTNNLPLSLVCLGIAAVWGGVFTIVPTLGFVLVNAIIAPFVVFFVSDSVFNATD